MHFVDVAIEPQAHIFLTKLGGDIDTLTQYLGKIHANPLPKDRPLWQCQIFILDNAFALYIKIHHTLIDGVGAMRMVMASFADGALPFWAQALTKNVSTPRLFMPHQRRPQRHKAHQAIIQNTPTFVPSLPIFAIVLVMARH